MYITIQGGYYSWGTWMVNAQKPQTTKPSEQLSQMTLPNEYKQTIQTVDNMIKESEAVIRQNLDQTFQLIQQANQRITEHYPAFVTPSLSVSAGEEHQAKSEGVKSALPPLDKAYTDEKVSEQVSESAHQGVQVTKDQVAEVLKGAQQAEPHAIDASNPDTTPEFLHAQAMQEQASSTQALHHQMEAATASIQQALQQTAAQLQQNVSAKQEAVNHFIAAQQQLHLQAAAEQVPSTEQEPKMPSESSLEAP